MFGVLADVACVEGWFGNKVPDPVRRLLDGVGRDTFYRPQPISAHLKQTLKQALASDTPMRPHLIEASAFHIIGFQLENLAHLEDISVTRADNDMVHDAYNLITATPHCAPTLSGLARLLNIPPNRLDRAFRATFGRSVHQATVDIRFDAICAALCDGEAIKVVAAQFGYTSVSNFSSAFRRKMGAPPRRWLKPAKPQGADPPNVLTDSLIERLRRSFSQSHDDPKHNDWCVLIGIFFMNRTRLRCYRVLECKKPLRGSTLD